MDRLKKPVFIFGLGTGLTVSAALYRTKQIRLNAASFFRSASATSPTWCFFGKTLDVLPPTTEVNAAQNTNHYWGVTETTTPPPKKKKLMLRDKQSSSYLLLTDGSMCFLPHCCHL